MCSTILLIGPLCVGKSTVGRLLAEKLGLPSCSTDGLPKEYLIESGLDVERAEMLAETEGWLAAYRHLQQIGVRMVERVLAERTRQVVDFGAPDTVYQDDSLFEIVKEAFAAYNNVVLLLPSPDLDESTRIVKERMAARAGHTTIRRLLSGLRSETGSDYEELYVKHHSNFQLARIVVYTNGKSPEQTRDEIIESLKLEARKQSL